MRLNVNLPKITVAHMQEKVGYSDLDCAYVVYTVYNYRCKRWVVKCRRKGLDDKSSNELNSPQPFNSLRNVVSLPSRTRLLPFLSWASRDLQTGYSERVFTLLKLRVKAIYHKDRNCCVVFGEMSPRLTCCLWPRHNWHRCIEVEVYTIQITSTSWK